MREGSGRRILAALLIGGALCAPLAVPADGVAETGSGDMVKERLELRGFSALQVSGSWEVEAAPGDFAVEVEVDDNVRDDVRVELRGNTLRFGLRQGARWFRRVSLRARVSLPDLEGVQVSGSGRVAAHGFEAPTLRLGVSGSGSIHAGGCRVGALDADVSGSGDLPWRVVSSPAPRSRSAVRETSSSTAKPRPAGETASRFASAARARLT